jgi:hypothetical protein
MDTIISKLPAAGRDAVYAAYRCDNSTMLATMLSWSWVAANAQH